MKTIKKISEVTPLNGEVVDSLSGSSTTNAPSIRAVNEGLNGKVDKTTRKVEKYLSTAGWYRVAELTSNSALGNAAIFNINTVNNTLDNISIIISVNTAHNSAKINLLGICQNRNIIYYARVVKDNLKQYLEIYYNGSTGNNVRVDLVSNSDTATLIDFLSSDSVTSENVITSYEFNALEAIGSIRQVSGLNIAKGENVQNNTIIGAKQVIIYYTVDSTGYLGSVVVPKTLANQWFTVVGKNNGSVVWGYFMVYFDTGRIASSSSTADVIKIVGYDTIK